MKQPRKAYSFSKTSPLVADVISKVRLMQALTAEEELLYLMQVKNFSEEAAQKIMDDKFRHPR